MSGGSQNVNRQNLVCNTQGDFHYIYIYIYISILTTNDEMACEIVLKIMNTKIL